MSIKNPKDVLPTKGD